MSLLTSFKNSLFKTRDSLTKKISSIFENNKEITDDLFSNLEETLILADVGIKTTTELTQTLKNRIKEKKIKLASLAKQELLSIVAEILEGDHNLALNFQPTVIILLGVNGVGKTTTIIKLANQFKQDGKSVLIASADTFRAAANQQLENLANKIECPIVSKKINSDPASVVFDSIVKAKQQNYDVVLCDTSGRLHTKKNLMNELEKIVRIAKKETQPEAVKSLLVLDASMGQNNLIQAEAFLNSVGVDGIILTKLDGTAKGGIAIAIKNSLKIPIKFIGVGENLNCLLPFNPADFSKTLLEL